LGKVRMGSFAKFSFLFLAFSAIIWGGNATNDGKRLIKTSVEEPAKWMTPEEIGNMVVRQDPPEFECPWSRKKQLVDITNDPAFSTRSVPKASTAAIPRNPRFQSIVNSLIPLANRSRVEEFVRHLSEDYHTRYYESDGGEASSENLHDEVRTLLYNYQADGSVTKVDHTWRQRSIIARLHGQDPVLKAERVILGAHIDSATWEDFITGHNNSRAPGADSDATGSAILMETLRILLAGDVRPRRTIEFHWYAAEEMGLLGSIDISRSYANAEVEVAAMIQFDRPGFQAPNVTDIGIFTDDLDVNPDLAQFTRDLTDEYLEFGWRDNKCGYACSDHTAWAEKGVPTAFISDASYPLSDIGCQHHFTANDTIDMISFNQVMEMVKIGVGLAVEIGEPIDN